MSVHNTRAVQDDTNVSAQNEHPRVVRRQQQQAGQEPCFATDKRYGCRNYTCSLREGCVKLIAAWLR